MKNEHLEKYAHEVHIPEGEAAWMKWATEVESLLGHSLDGDEHEDGYSLDSAFKWFKLGAIVEKYVNMLTATKARIAAEKEAGDDFEKKTESLINKTQKLIDDLKSGDAGTIHFKKPKAKVLVADQNGVTNPLTLLFLSGQYKVNKPGNQEGKYVSYEIAKALLEALEELVEKCLHSDEYKQKVDELFKAQQAIKLAKP